MKKRSVLGLMGAALLSLSTMASAAGNAENGAELAAGCFGCHGEDGHSVVPSFPKLAGLQADYTAKQIFDFQGGKRTDETMVGMSYMVASKQDALDIGAYFESQSPMKGEATGSKITQKGAKAYADLGCATCHGIGGEGKGNLFPRIGGQHLDYLAKTLQDFRSGERTSDRSGMMAPLAKKLTDDQIESLADYISGL